MKKLSNALIIAMLILNSCADESFLNPSELSNVILPSNGATEYLEVSIRKAPIAPDGTTAKAKTDIVLTFVDIDPTVDGIGLKAGATVEVKLPSEFVNTGGGTNSIFLLQGWPQSPPALNPPPPPFIFPWTTTVDGNTITATLTGDYLVDMFGPGPKQAHLLLLGFENPKPGKYEIPIRIRPGPAPSKIMSGIGEVIIIPKSRPSIHAISLFSGGGPPPPFFNPIYQEVILGESAVRVGMYLWDKDNEPFLGVDLQMVNLSHGLLVQNGSTVGQVRIDAPPGANNYSLTTEGPSAEIPAFITGSPTGLLLVQFTTDSAVAGNYTLSFRLNNGNTQDLFVTVLQSI
jgi:hypothetical protein